jgi:2-amino-4-hydroxy-6-hydroxymethyldihydropteridine diphosphokinase
VILVGIGSNLAAPGFDRRKQTAGCALAALPESASRSRRSQWYASEPVPASDQPWFVNAVVAVRTELARPAARAAACARSRFGRGAGVRDAARTLDLDLLDYDGRLCATPDLVLPHPRLHERRFVLAPLCEIAPNGGIRGSA